MFSRSTLQQLRLVFYFSPSHSLLRGLMNINAPCFFLSFSSQRITDTLTDCLYLLFVWRWSLLLFLVVRCRCCLLISVLYFLVCTLHLQVNFLFVHTYHVAIHRANMCMNQLPISFAVITFDDSFLLLLFFFFFCFSQ